MKNKKQNKDLGIIGETFVLERLIDKGFSLYKRNIRQWGSEIDLVVYKYNPISKFLDIRVGEVKTRMALNQMYLSTLHNYDLENKWRRIKGKLFQFRDLIVHDTGFDVEGSSSHFDLAIVFLKSDVKIVDYNQNIKNILRMHTYLKDINLFI